MKFLIFKNSDNVVARIPKEELAAKAGRFSRPYSNPNGSDAKSLSAVIDTSRVDDGKIEWEISPVKIVYSFDTDEAIVSVNWKNIKRMSEKVKFPIIVKGNYSFQKTIILTIVKTEYFFAIRTEENVTSRDKVKIGEIKITPICSNYVINNEAIHSHKLVISRIDGLTVSPDISAGLTSDITYEVPYNEEKIISLYYGFGDCDTCNIQTINICGYINGMPFSEKINVSPYCPHLSANLEILQNEISLRPDVFDVAKLILKSDAREGGAILNYELNTNSDIIRVKDDNVGEVSPGEEKTVILTYDGDKLRSLPNDNITINIINIINNEEKLSEIVLMRNQDQEAGDKAIKIKLKNIGKWSTDRQRITIYKGGAKELKFTIIPKYTIQKVSARIEDGGDNISLKDPQSFSLVKDQRKDITVLVNPEVEDDCSFSLVISADYYMDLISTSRIVMREPHRPSLKFVYEQKEEKKIYKTDEKFYLGKLKIESLKSEENQKIEDCAIVDLSTLHVLSNEGEELSFFELEPTSNSTSLMVGEEVTYDVYVNAQDQESKKIDYLFQVKSTGNYSFDSKEQHLFIKDKSPQEIPTLSFHRDEEKLIFPNVNEILHVGVIKINKSSYNNIKEIERSNGTLKIESEAFFFENSQKEISITDIDECSLYFDALKHFEGKDNIEDEHESVDFVVKYRDNITTDWEEIAVTNNSITITQRDSSPIPQLIWTKDKTETVIDVEAKSGVIDLGSIGYTNYAKEQGKRKLFELKIKNAQLISIPKRTFEIKSISSSAECVEIEGPEQYTFADNSDSIIFKFYMNWSILEEKHRGELEGFEIDIDFGDTGKYVLKVNVSVFEQITSEWVSLDLGTSAIVMAKKVNGEVKPIPLRDAEDPEGRIEEHDCIISSNIVFKKLDEEGNHELILSPERRILNNASAILPPIKFIVGQDHLPFYECFRNHGVKTVRSEYLNQTNLSEVNPGELLQSVYNEIFDRMDPDNRKSMRKLILTYPSTYTIDQINCLKKLISSKESLSEKNIVFVPESDAVLAYYLGTNRVSNGGRALKDGERIVIYDMGAGTLDISYIRITKKEKITATIEKRIGIPIAGNYLDNCIYKAMSSKLSPYMDLNDENPNNKPTVANLKKQIQDLKKHLDNNNTSINELNWKKKEEIMTYAQLIDSKEVQNFLTKCTTEVLSLLLGENWKDEIDTFVYSGRGCMFKPLIDHIKKNAGGNWTIERVSESNDEMKLCAAKGAVKYVEMFAPDSKQPFRIISFRQYASFGLVYCSYKEDNTLTYKCEILKSAEEFSNVTDIVTESDSGTIQGIDIRPHGRMVVVQSYLNKERIADSYNNRAQKKTDSDGCFISEIFSVLREDLGIDDTDLDNADVEYSLDNHTNTINCTVQGQSLRSHQFSESIENNQFYKDGMWPYNN